MRSSFSFGLLILLFINTSAQIIPYGSAWKYLDNGSDQGTAWMSTTFSDEEWQTGATELGYGDGDEATLVSYGADATQKHITTYFRKTFLIDDISVYQSFTASVKRDDGIVIYVNGSEVYRDNMPEGTINYDTKALMSSQAITSFSIEASYFNKGTNIIAAEVHQNSNHSSDISFNLKLEGIDITDNDEAAPVVLSSNRLSPTTKTTNASSVIFRVTFSKPVIGVDKTDFIATIIDGNLSAKVNDVKTANIDGTTYDVTVSSISGTGILRLDVKSSGTGISYIAGEALVKGFNSGQTYTITGDTIDNAILTRGPYLQMGNQSAVTLRWRTNNPTVSTIEVGTSPDNYPLSATDATVTTEHEVRISGLTPNTKYYYRFGSNTQILQGDASNYFYTAPTDQTTAKTRIAVFGDCGRNSNGNQSGSLSSYLNHVGNTPAELMLLLGDNAYPDGTDVDYQEHFFDFYGNNILKNHIIFPAPGNHDYHPGPKSSRSLPYYKIFTMPTEAECGGIPSGTEAFYSFDWGNIHFISMDSYGTEDPDESTIYDTLGPQVNWVKKDLDANTKPWVVVYWHHPPYSKGSHDSDEEEYLTDIRQNLLRILERYGVDLVLTGHSHNYERSYLLDNYYGTESSFDMDKHAISSSSGKYNGTKNSCPYVTTTGAQNNGTVYVVSGSAGASGSIQSGYPHDALPFAFNDGGMLYLEVENNRLDGKFLRKDGEVADQFTIMQNVNKNTTTTISAGSTVQLQASWVGEYKWSNGSTNRSISVTPNGNTTYRVTDNSNCITDVFNITVNAANTIKAESSQLVMENNNISAQMFPTLVQRGSRVTLQTNVNKIQEAVVIDDNGRFMDSFKFINITQVETKNLAAGTYLIIVKDSGKVSTYKFIVIN